MEQQTQQSMQETVQSKPPAKTNWKYLAIVAAVAVLAGGGILLLKTMQPVPAAQVPQPTSTSSPQPQTPDTEDFTLSEVEGWQTYRNDEFGFEVKYPEG